MNGVIFSLTRLKFNPEFDINLKNVTLSSDEDDDAGIDDHYLVSIFAYLSASDQNFQLHKISLALKDIVKGMGKNALKDFLETQTELKSLELSIVGQSVNRVLGSVSRLVLNHHAPEELLIHSTMVTLCGLSKVFAGKYCCQIKTLALMCVIDMKKIQLLVKFLQGSTYTVKNLKLYNLNKKGKNVELPPRLREVLFSGLQEKKNTRDMIIGLY